MKQFEKNYHAYDQVRAKIKYPSELYHFLVDISKNKHSALDLGCGNGVSTFHLKNTFIDVDGVDLGEKLIESARVNYPEINFFVSKSEDFFPSKKYDLVTCATAFYWMDRVRVLDNINGFLNEAGVFCAYKYDWPVVYSPVRNFIEKELSDRWSKYRDPRIENYDDTLELIQSSGHFKRAERKVFSNILELTSQEVAYFFLSTSYVTKYIESESGENYKTYLINKIEELSSGAPIKINFDVHAFFGYK
jgi:SAM-dependent methyltransferase